MGKREFGQELSELFPRKAPPLASTVEPLKEQSPHFADELGDALEVVINREVIQIPLNRSRNASNQIFLMAVLSNEGLHFS